MTDRIEMLDRSIAALERTLERTSRIAAADIGDNHMRLRIVEDRLSLLADRVAALEHATCTESEPDSENAPMTPEQEWADVGLEGEWLHSRASTLHHPQWVTRDSRVAVWRRLGRWGIRCDRTVSRSGTLRAALAAAREHAPVYLLRYLWPRDEWRTFEECEPEEGQWVETNPPRAVTGMWSGGGVVVRGTKHVRPYFGGCAWRPADPTSNTTEAVAVAGGGFEDDDIPF